MTNLKELIRVLTTCRHPQERQVQIVNDGGRSVIQWCGCCGALRTLDGTQTWMRPDVATSVVELAVEALEVDGA